MSQLITSDLVRLDVELGADKHETIRGLAGVVGAADRTHDVEQVVTDAFAREAQSATGLPGGIAIPHCRTAGVTEPTLAFARLSPPVDFGAKDGPAELVFLILAPEGGDNTHMKLLTQLARALVKRDFTDALRAATSTEEVAELVTTVVEPARHPLRAAQPAGQHAAPPAAAAATTRTPPADPGVAAWSR